MEHSISLATFRILQSQLLDFYEPFFLLDTQEKTIVESTFTFRLERHKALAYNKPSNKS